MFIDSHCHLSLEPLLNDIEKVLDDCSKNKVSKILTISTNLKNSIISSNISSKYSNVYSSIGIHPNESHLDFKNDNFLQILFKKNLKNVAYGETGLDFHYSNKYKNRQIELFEKHIKFANEDKSTVIVHSRSAEDETLSVIKNNSKFTDTNFLIHCFTGSTRFAKSLLDLGCYLSFSGIITFKNAQYLRDIISFVPLDRILVETDSPYLAPVPFRGKTNYPKYIPIILDKIAEIKKSSINNLASVIEENFNKIFKI